MSRIPDGEIEFDANAQRRHALWIANSRRELRSKRGQAFLRELLEALEALPQRRLIEGRVAHDGCTCALGALALKRGVDGGRPPDVVMAELERIYVYAEGRPPEEDEEDEVYIWEWAEHALGAPRHIAWLVPSENDDGGTQSVYAGEGDNHVYVRQEPVTPEERWVRMHRWVRRHLRDEVCT